jgi:Helix-turn-helix domain
MSRFQQGSLLKMRGKGARDVWVFRCYGYKGGDRSYMKRIIGTVIEFPQPRNAEKTLVSFRVNINSQVVRPQRVRDLIAHYQRRELVPERKAFASIATHLMMTRRCIEPEWGQHQLRDERTMQVEEWLHPLALARGSKTKIKSAFSVLYRVAEFLSVKRKTILDWTRGGIIPVHPYGRGKRVVWRFRISEIASVNKPVRSTMEDGSPEMARLEEKYG